MQASSRTISPRFVGRLFVYTQQYHRHHHPTAVGTYPKKEMQTIAFPFLSCIFAIARIENAPAGRYEKNEKHRIMKISRIEHLGIAVKSIEEALPYYEQVLGFECYNIETVEDQKVRTAFLKVGDTKIELLEATSPDSTIAKFIENRGEGIHHIAYKVEDGVANALDECTKKEIRTIDKEPRNGAEGLHIAFLHPKSTQGVLTELCEE